MSVTNGNSRVLEETLALQRKKKALGPIVKIATPQLTASFQSLKQLNTGDAALNLQVLETVSSLTVGQLSI